MFRTIGLAAASWGGWHRPLWLLALSSGLLVAPMPAMAGPSATAGPYRVELSSDPPVIPVSSARLVLRVTSGGEPVRGATVRAIVQMPGMPMGEREEMAVPEPAQAGVYVVPAQFGMEGAYDATIRISGAEGEGTAVISLRTGENTATAGAAGLGWLWGLLLVPLVFLVLYRMRRTGQRVNLRPLLSWQFLAGAGAIALTLAVATWAVRKYTAPGQMSVVEAQAMDMTAMKPPVGAVPVAAMAAKRQRIESTVSYTGSAVSFLDQEVAPRVAGTVVWMPFYPGQRVKRGELLARLDSQELTSRTNEQAASRAMAVHAEQIARMQYQQSLGQKSQAEAQASAAQGAEADAEQGKRKALAAVRTAQTELAASRGELSSAEQDVSAAAEERAGAEADLEGARTQITDAQAQLAAAKADADYQTQRQMRSQVLLASGAVSREEYQQDQAMAANAVAKVRQSQARVDQVNAAIRGSQARIRKADAMLAGAKAKVAQMQAKSQGSQTRIEEAQADAVGADAKIQQAKAAVDAAQANARSMGAASNAAQHEIMHTAAGVTQAQAQLTTAELIQGYTEIRANVDGMVTQRVIGPGTLVSPGQTILRISQVSPIRLQANVAESDLAKIRVGSLVRAHRAGDGKVSEARVTAVFPAVDPTSRTGVVETLIPNRDGRFLPGQYLTMDITTGESRDAVVVPARSVVWQPHSTPGQVLSTGESPHVWLIQSGEPEKTDYTCTMHPEVKQDKPGKCPT